MKIKVFFDMRDAETDVTLDKIGNDEQFQTLKRLLDKYVKNDTLTIEFDLEADTAKVIKTKDIEHQENDPFEYINKTLDSRREELERAVLADDKKRIDSLQRAIVFEERLLAQAKEQYRLADAFIEEMGIESSEDLREQVCQMFSKNTLTLESLLPTNIRFDPKQRFRFDWIANKAGWIGGTTYRIKDLLRTDGLHSDLMVQTLIGQLKRGAISLPRIKLDHDNDNELVVQLLPRGQNA